MTKRGLRAVALLGIAIAIVGSACGKSSPPVDLSDPPPSNDRAGTELKLTVDGPVKIGERFILNIAEITPVDSWGNGVAIEEWHDGAWVSHSVIVSDLGDPDSKITFFKPGDPIPQAPETTAITRQAVEIKPGSTPGWYRLSKHYIKSDESTGAIYAASVVVAVR